MEYTFVAHHADHFAATPSLAGHGIAKIPLFPSPPIMNTDHQVLPASIGWSSANVHTKDQILVHVSEAGIDALLRMA
jgi:hypothetical protein